MTARLCHPDGHVIVGSSKLIYVRLGHGEQFQHERLRFCAFHANGVYEHLSQFEVEPVDGTTSWGNLSESNCLTCGEPGGEPDWYLFITCYPTKDERKDYRSRLHVACQLPEALRSNERSE